MREHDLAAMVTEIASPLAASLGLRIWGVEVLWGRRGLVRVYVEGDAGTDIDTCAELSRLLGLSLDVADIIDGAYVLEVSSPGLERTFFTADQLAAFAGQTVEVSLRAPVAACPGRKKLLGTLTGVTDGVFSLVLRDAPSDVPPLSFTWEEVKTARLVHFLPAEPVKGKGKGARPSGKAASADTDDKNDTA